MLKLKKFQVLNFRSVEDSGWIETDQVTALIGTNESGKTNVLLPLWKLNPAKEGSISPTADYPRKHYNTFRHEKPKPVFIRAVFEIDDELVSKISEMSGMPTDAIRQVQVARSFDSEYDVEFPNAKPVRAIGRERVLSILAAAERDLAVIPALKTEEELKGLLVQA